ncbi:MAG: hypothetical protein J1E81_06085 [Eubacterium sp.]|nr:hypothetical protein [Eubacterium sp.]
MTDEKIEKALAWLEEQKGFNTTADEYIYVEAIQNYINRLKAENDEAKELCKKKIGDLKVNEWIKIMKLAGYEVNAVSQQEQIEQINKDKGFFVDDLKRNKENRQLIELPCKIGDTVYWCNGITISPYRVNGFADYGDGFGLRLLIGEMQASLQLLGQDLFLEKEQAEQKLKGLRGEL